MPGEQLVAKMMVRQMLGPLLDGAPDELLQLLRDEIDQELERRRKNRDVVEGTAEQIRLVW